MKVESVHDLNKIDDKKRISCFIMQYTNGIYIYTKSGGDHNPTYKWEEISGKGLMKPIRMKRGFNNTFYFVQSDQLGNSDIIMELTLEEQDTTYVWSTRQIYEINSGQAISLEIDPDSTAGQLDY